MIAVFPEGDQDDHTEDKKNCRKYKEHKAAAHQGCGGIEIMITQGLLIVGKGELKAVVIKVVYKVSGKLFGDLLALTDSSLRNHCFQIGIGNGFIVNRKGTGVFGADDRPVTFVVFGNIIFLYSPSVRGLLCEGSHNIDDIEGSIAAGGRVKGLILVGDQKNAEQQKEGSSNQQNRRDSPVCFSHFKQVLFKIFH